ncbi:MAG: hypothetical protein H6773_03210 [Pseudomonadales bacterium]|nr:hypothetical protein [Candidatus Woesebacteria bacterium]MCB9801165.1 hypothetical protein [Pseudomonadales bacterium]
MLKKNPLYQSGQVAVVVLLIMVVLLTIGLSLATRTTQELFLSDQQADSVRVFNAAESGIEEALSQVTEGQQTLTVDGVDVTFDVQGSSRLEARVAEGASLHLDLSGYDNDITFNWASEGDCTNRASLVAHIFYDDSGTTRSIAIPFGPSCDGHTDNFIDANTIGGDPYYHRYVLQATQIPSGALFMRVRPVYADTDILVEGNIGFPTQYYIISSSATYTEGDEERNIEVSRTLPAGPAYMDYALYSGGAINSGVAITQL